MKLRSVLAGCLSNRYVEAMVMALSEDDTEVMLSSVQMPQGEAVPLSSMSSQSRLRVRRMSHRLLPAQYLTPLLEAPTQRIAMQLHMSQ